MDVNFVDCVSHIEHTINVEKKEYFWNIYKKIKKKWKNPHEFTLVFEGNIINKYNRVSEYAIKDGSTVILLQQNSSYFTVFNSREHTSNTVFPRSYFSTSRRRRPRSRRARFQSPNLTINPPPVPPPPPPPVSYPPPVPSILPPPRHHGVSIDSGNNEINLPPGLLASTSELNLISDIQTILRNVIHSEINQAEQEEKRSEDRDTEEKQSEDRDTEEKQTEDRDTEEKQSEDRDTTLSSTSQTESSDLPTPSISSSTSTSGTFNVASPPDPQTMRTYFRSLYSSQIRIMTEMGYLNTDAILDALILNNGDINDSIEFF